ncbi:uncharacterized protein LOC126770702 [Nymphalis io]|uniref:uncharacterized protein LOC126770702 n=1 Tax=Inachis io TaxID=171585 RepID=UPI00216A9DFD|nr:uncharacterized protein LOC126770702 [Nymphalis io]XP_050346167.1 uncharacterized protein LOC126770702 [Nymphalis io]XP_050346168.1 uncharacterized protein LOC126770702 [Nymphalis io]
MLRLIASLLTCLAAVGARDVGKAFRTMPIVTNSLVNLGKMDIAFYFNARPQDLARSELASHRSSSMFGSRVESLMTEPCPCSSLKYIRDSSQNNPSDLLRKILSGNDLFSFKEPASSTLCCDSHENVQEDVLLEFGPKQSQILANQQDSFPLLPFLLNSVQSKPNSHSMTPKAKSVEIIIFPKKRGLSIDIDKFTSKNKDVIKLVGNKEIRNDIKSNQFVPPFITSVKKDLAHQAKTENVTKKGDETKLTVDNKSNVV